MGWFFDVNTVAVTVWDYPMSWIELVGTVFNLWSVWLVARNRIATWPVGIVGIVLFMALFYQIQLYADVFEQGYALLASFYGWWLWAQREQDADRQPITSTGRVVLISGVVTLALSGLAGWLLGQLDTWLPALFPLPASYPYVDALTTMMSFTATFLMAQKRVECWYYWIAVDVIGVALYGLKDVRFVALLYLCFLVLAVGGLLSWKRQMGLHKAHLSPTSKLVGDKYA